jgi:hypothetical protein
VRDKLIKVFFHGFGMQKNLFALSFMVVWIVLTAICLLWGFKYDFPDYVHVNYGIPLTWATNTLSTIAGPADSWTVNVSSLLLDLVFWLSIMTTAVALMLYKLKN